MCTEPRRRLGDVTTTLEREQKKIKVRKKWRENIAVQSLREDLDQFRGLFATQWDSLESQWRRL